MPNLENEWSFLSELNDQQKMAVITSGKKVCVIAGAGCGKTKTLISRVLYLIRSKQTQASEILLLTFSKKAIAEIQRRITNSLVEKEGLPWIANIHSFCFKLLRQYSSLIGYPNNVFPLYDQKDQEEVLKKIFADHNLSAGKDGREIYHLVSLISFAKVTGDAKFNSLAKKERALAHEYQTFLAVNQALDFNDLLTTTVKILEQFPLVRAEYQKKFTHVLVDEFQDVNDIQWKIMNLLISSENNLFLVGDPNQSIYGFQGSSPNLIKSLEHDDQWTK